MRKLIKLLPVALIPFLVLSCDKDEESNSDKNCENIQVFTTLASDEKATGSFKRICANSPEELAAIKKMNKDEFDSQFGVASKKLTAEKEAKVAEAFEKLDPIIDGISGLDDENKIELIAEYENATVNGDNPIKLIAISDKVKSLILDANAAAALGITREDIIPVGIAQEITFEEENPKDKFNTGGPLNSVVTLNFEAEGKDGGKAMEVTIPAGAERSGTIQFYIKSKFNIVPGANYNFSYDWKAVSDDHRIKSFVYSRNVEWDNTTAKGGAWYDQTGGESTDWVTSKKKNLSWTEAVIKGNLTVEGKGSAITRPEIQIFSFNDDAGKVKETKILIDNIKFERVE